MTQEVIDNTISFKHEAKRFGKQTWISLKSGLKSFNDSREAEIIEEIKELEEELYYLRGCINNEENTIQQRL